MAPIRIAVAVCVAMAWLTMTPTFALETAPLRYSVDTTPESFIPYAASHSLTSRNTNITRVIFSIHSRNFDALQYYDNARNAALQHGTLDETLIIAPQLFEQKVIPGTPAAGLLFWRVNPFRGSSRAAIGPEARKVRVSAFAVLDSIIADIVAGDAFPSLRDIVLVGHSGGGQLVQRYAMVGKFKPPPGLTIRYVVSAPSSYAYPSKERFLQDRQHFAVPDEHALQQCPGYDNWGYGLGEPYAYIRGQSTDSIANEYAKKNVFYLCGSRDSDPNDEMIGKDCGAMMQGRTRLERMQVFQKFLTFKYGREILRHHRFAVVPNVGHFGRDTMNSQEGLTAMFGPLASE